MLVKAIAALAAVLAAAGAAVWGSGSSEPPSVQHANFESGDLSQWRHRQCLPERVSVGSGRPAAFDGRYRVRVEVRDGDVEPETGSERCELVGPRLPDERERWFRLAIYVPSSATPPDSWQIISQWYSITGGSPPLALFNNMGLPMRWSLRTGDSTKTYWRSRKLARNRWHEIVVGVFLSQSRSRGWVKVWFDGKRQRLANGRTRMHGRTRGPVPGAFITGIYRDPASTGTSIQYMDHYSVGPTRKSVMPD
jgi:Polysaccharide lyase